MAPKQPHSFAATRQYTMAGTQFQIASDLHLETPSARPTYDEFAVEQRCPHLALLGDIGLVFDERLFEFLERHLRRFQVIFYVLGNHEPYETNYTVAKDTIRAFADTIEQRRLQDGNLGQLVLLDQTRYDITPDLTILGCTLFSRILPEQENTIPLFVTDFERIGEWTVKAHQAAHAADLAWLNKCVSHINRTEPHRCVIIFTHYCPSILEEAIGPQRLKDPAQVRSAFSTDLSEEAC